MKNRFFFFLFLGFLSWKNSKAQAYIYHPFPDSGAIWYTGAVDIPDCIPNPCYYYIYQLGKDTIVNNLKYSQILQGGINNSTGVSGLPSFNGYLIRNDTLNKEVLIHDVGNNNPDELFYDFNLSVGDTIPDGFISAKIFGVYVTGIDSILIEDGTYRKRFKLNSVLTGTFPDSLYLIEGIGYTGGLFTEISPNMGFEGGYHFACNSYLDTTLYNFAPLGLTSCDLPSGINQITEPIIQILPNPVASGSNIIIKGISENYSLTISNVLGQIVFSTPMSNSQSITLPGSIKSGVYICRILTQDNLFFTKKIVVL